MATIYTTKVVYKAVSSQTIYSFGFDYLNKTFVKVKLGGQDLTYLQDYTVDEKTINLTNPPTQGVNLEIYRSTSTEQEVQWEDSSVFRANTLNLFQTQLLHLSQEALDGIRKASLKQDEMTYKWDAEGIQINNVGDPQESQDAVNLRYLSNLQDGYITQVEALITNAKNVAEADHTDYLNRFMTLLANEQGQADRAESEATRAYNEANRAKEYAEKALQSSTGNTDPITQTEVDSKLSLHNTDGTAHQSILDMINSNQTEVNNKIALHSTDETVHGDIRLMFNNYLTRGETENQLSTHNTDLYAHTALLNAHNADVNAHTAILDAIKAISGMSAYDIAPSKTIASIIPLLEFGGIVAQKLEATGYVKFANRFTIQWGNAPSPVKFPIAFSTACLNVVATLQTNGDTGNMSKNRMYVDTISNDGFSIQSPQGSYRYIAVGY